MLLKTQCIGNLRFAAFFKAREEISKVLSAVRDDFNTSEECCEGVQNAFQETLLGKKKQSSLAALLAECADNKWSGKYEPSMEYHSNTILAVT